MGTFRRALAVIGLAGVGWVGYTLVAGDVSLADAGVRSGAILVVIVLLTRLFGVGIRLLATSLDG